LRTRNPNRISLILVLAIVALGVIWIVFSRYAAPALIKSAYHGGSWHIFNGMISGQASHPLEEYLSDWEELSWYLLLIFSVTGLSVVLAIRHMKLIPQIDTYPGLVSFAQKPAGKVLCLAVFAAGLVLLREPLWLELTAILALMTFLPQYRRICLTFSTLYWLIIHPAWNRWNVIGTVARREGVEAALNIPLLQVLMGLVVICFCGAVAHVFFRWNHSPLTKRPVLALHVFYILLLLSACYGPFSGQLRVLLWTFLVGLGSYFWYFGYTLLDQSSKGRDPYSLQLGTYRPMWNGSWFVPTPFVKGAAYLRKIEAKNPQELAVTQLKGIKLLYWVLLLSVVLALFTQTVHDFRHSSESALLNKTLKLTGMHLPLQLGIPVFEDALARSVARKPYPWYTCWASLITVFFKNMLAMSVWGNQIVACCRMAGFRALRNTYRPLESKTIAEFWNRYYFYFKEVLVDFYFYPTYTRYLKGYRRARLFAATLAAACFGNMFFQFIRNLNYIWDLGLWKTLLGFHVYAFYAFVLGTGIAISQLRSRNAVPQSPHWFRDRILPSMSVVLFYSLLTIFNDWAPTTYPITERFSFLAHLFAFWS